MLKDEDINAAGLALYQAEKNRTQINLLSIKHPTITMDDAYRIQDAFVGYKQQHGHQQIGWKIGLTSKAMQNALGIDIPDSGVLCDNMLFSDGAVIPQMRFIQPRVEAEIAFVMKADVNEASEQAILAATDYVLPAVEILDTRVLRHDPVTGQNRKVFDTIADNAANAGVVLGNKKHDPQDIDLRWVGVIMARDNEVQETGLGAAVLNNPLTSMLWLVQRLARYGQRITAGQIVLSGSFIKIIEAPSGSSFFADFGAFGSVTLTFE